MQSSLYTILALTTSTTNVPDAVFSIIMIKVTE